MKIDMSLEEFIKNMYNYDKLEGKEKEIFQEFADFVLRVRKSSEKDDKNDYENIAYYHGLKSFTLKKDKNIVKLDFPINVYKCSPKGLKKAHDLEEGNTLLKKEESYRNRIAFVCNAMSPLYDFSMSAINYNIDLPKEKEEKDKFIANYNKIINEFEDIVIRYKKDFVKDDVFTLINDDLSNLEGRVKEKLTFNKIITSKKDIPNNKKATPYSIIMIQYWFLRLISKIGHISGIKFNYKSEYREKRAKRNDNDEFKIKIFAKSIKKAIESYNDSEKKEKIYQHQFMLHAQNSNIFSLNKGEYIEAFEQEYGIYNPVRNKNGRIDCIFYKYKLDKEKIIITGIYLIELKVDSDVVLGNNGVMTHLDDIREFLRFDSSKYPNREKYDVKHLKNRIVDRIEILKGYKKENICFANEKMYFYTVIAFTDEFERQIVSDMLDGLYSHEKVRIWADKEYRKKNNINSKQLLIPYFKDKTIDDIKPTEDECEIKFFFEDGLYKGKISDKFTIVNKKE